MPTITKTTENRLRRVATRQGFTLHKSRARDPRHQVFGKYQLRANRHVMKLYDLDPKRWMTIDEIAVFLQESI